MRLCFALLLALLPACGAVGFVRYGLTQARPGQLKVGEQAPDPLLVDLDGDPLLLHQELDGRPLVLIFGSFT